MEIDKYIYIVSGNKSLSQGGAALLLCWFEVRGPVVPPQEGTGRAVLLWCRAGGEVTPEEGPTPVLGTAEGARREEKVQEQARERIGMAICFLFRLCTIRRERCWQWEGRYRGGHPVAAVLSGRSDLFYCGQTVK